MVTTPEELEQLAEVLAAESAAARSAALARPRCYILDKDGAYRGELDGEITASIDDLLNAAGDAVVELPADHHLARWSLGLPVEETFSLIVEDANHPRPWEDRWSGVVTHVDRPAAATGDEQTVEWTFVHDYRTVADGIVCWANPFAPAAAQWPKASIQAAPAETAIKSFLVANLVRLFAGLWTLPDPVWDPAAWAERWKDVTRPFDWPIFVVPAPNILLDTTQWTVLVATFTNFGDLIADTLADAQLRLKVWRWLPGDPQPAPDHATLTRPTICVDVVEQRGRTDYTGTLVDGAIKYVDFLTEDMRETGWQPILDPGLPTTGKTAGRDETLPVYREGQHTDLAGVPGGGMTVVKPECWQITHGGKSPGWVNSGIKLGVNSALGNIGRLIGLPGLSGAFDDQIEDVILAYAVGRSERRRRAAGRFIPPERFIANGNGFSLSTLQVQRAGLYDTRGRVGYTASVENGVPYTVYRDYGVGDRVGVEENGRVWVTRCFGVRREWDRDSDVKTAITLGDSEHAMLPEARLLAALNKLGAIARALGVES